MNKIRALFFLHNKEQLATLGNLLANYKKKQKKQ